MTRSVDSAATSNTAAYWRLRRPVIARCVSSITDHTLAQETWSRFVGSDMSAVTLVTVPPASQRQSIPSWRASWAYGRGRWRAPFGSDRVYHEGFEQFISIGHGPPPFNRAKAGAHYTAFPHYSVRSRRVPSRRQAG